MASTPSSVGHGQNGTTTLNPLSVGQETEKINPSTTSAPQAGFDNWSKSSKRSSMQIAEEGKKRI